jgi:hypothetical protein
VAPAVGAMLALSAALAAACFIKAFGVTFLGRPRTHVAMKAHETDGFSLAAMFAFTALCLVPGLLPGFVIDALSPVVRSLVGEGGPVQSFQPLFSIVPQMASRNSYDGMLIFLFIAVTGGLTAALVRAIGGARVRRSAAWDCGFPDASPATQYSAASFAQPIRRVFGTIVFEAHEDVEMRRPGDTGPARFHVSMRDLTWDAFYAPVVQGVGFAAQKLNHLQFLTIRRYLGLVFSALIFLLLVLAIWQ